MSTHMKMVLLFCAAMLMVASVGCAGDPNGTGATPVTDEQTAEAAADETAAKAGTRTNPLPVGEAAKVGGWELTVTGVDTDADAAIKKANDFNDPPSDGNRYVVVSVDAKYVGDDSGTFWVDMIYKFYGSGGNTFDSAMAVVSNPITDAGETFPDASVSGNLVFEVPADQIDDGAVIFEEMSFGDTSRTFWAVK